MAHPTMMVRDNYGRDRPKILPECPYHLTRCCGMHAGIAPLIKVPNSEGLCAECYFFKMKHKPPLLTLELSPGVCPVIAVSTGPKDVNGKVALCQWKPSKEQSVTAMRGYICLNPAIVNPFTGELLANCGMHAPCCLRPHSDGKGTIDIPNIYGLCTMHHISEYGLAPVPVPFPYPGVERKLKSKGWVFKPEHWAAPTWLPKKDIFLKRYVPPPEPATFLEKLTYLLEKKLHER